MGILPDYGDVRTPSVRARYGRLEAVVGLAGNTVVFVGKLLLALAISSMAVLGAVRQKEWEEDGEYWVVMLDPEENEFCVQ